MFFLTETMQKIAQLGTEQAQRHYATTTDLDGPLPWLPTDADHQELVKMLGRAPTLAELREHDNGYRESMLRLDGNAHSPMMSGPMWHEISTLLSRYGFLMPAEGTPERQRAQVLVMRTIEQLRREINPPLGDQTQHVGFKGEPGPTAVGT